MKNYELWYTKPAPFGNENTSMYVNKIRGRHDDGWEQWSLPLGNGYMGVNVFGRTASERLLITENSLCNPYAKHKDYGGSSAGLSNFCSIYMDFGHEKVKKYKRSLNLNNAMCSTEYIYNNIQFKREHFTSYPDKIFATHLTADKKNSISFTLRAEVTHNRPYLYESGDGMGKNVDITASDNTITIKGKMDYYGILFEGIITVINQGGSVFVKKNTLEIENSDCVTILFALGTNYKMEERVFLEENHAGKLSPYAHPHEKVCKITENAKKYKYAELKERHISDYKQLFDRVDVNLSSETETIATNMLLHKYKLFKNSVYLEELLFQYGRYLLISASRPGGYPTNLQGIWNKYDSSPWSAGYWHNINVQMNYWPAFNTNLLETFEPYIEYYKAYRKLAENHASEYIKAYFPENFDEENGIAIATGGWLYKMEKLPDPKTGHSGAGTGAFTTKLFTDYFDFSMDKKFLEETGYTANRSMAVFLSKLIEKQNDGKLLIKYSASPEQSHKNKYYHTKGCAFDQQMVYQCWKDTIREAEILGKKDAFIESIKNNIENLDPVQLGASGQIKEFREENRYGEIGDKKHRHISHLVGLYPGNLINADTPEWIKAAQITLNKRGDKSTGWSTAHKLNLWARTKNGERAYALLKTALSQCIMPNLWDTHPPFQIDGNYGITAGIAEMLIQSHEGYIHLIPAINNKWKNGSFDGLTARGGFIVSATWQNKKLKKIKVLSKAGEHLKIKTDDGFIETDTQIDHTYYFDL